MFTPSFVWVVIVSITVAASAGCSGQSKQQLRLSQLRTRQMYLQSQQLASERDQATQTAQMLAGERDQMQQTVTAMQQELGLANQRLANLQQERGEIQDRYKTLLTQLNASKSPLSDDITRRFEDLARRYPEFDFDPATGVSKFHSDILFGSGSADLRPEATPLLREFADIMNSKDAHRLNILVVGHTDDKAIRQDRLKVIHPTNWHLSTNRANSVVMTLAQLGMEETRMGSAGYSMFQPVTSNGSEDARQRNRRVEIYVMAPDAAIAGWDPTPGNQRR